MGRRFNRCDIETNKRRIPAGQAEPGAAEATPVSALEPEQLRDLDELIAEGLSAADVAEGVNERHGTRVSETGVEIYYRTNLELQKRRAQRLVKRAEDLKRALGDPESAEAQLAEAALMTGFLALQRPGGELSLKDAELIRLRREKLQLEKQLLVLRTRKVSADIHFRRAQLRIQRQKLKLIEDKTREFMEQVRAARGEKQDLGPEALRKIQEIYGIVSIPNIPLTQVTR